MGKLKITELGINPLTFPLTAMVPVARVERVSKDAMLYEFGQRYRVTLACGHMLGAKEWPNDPEYGCYTCTINRKPIRNHNDTN